MGLDSNTVLQKTILQLCSYTGYQKSLSGSNKTLTFFILPTSTPQQKNYGTFHASIISVINWLKKTGDATVSIYAFFICLSNKVITAEMMYCIILCKLCIQKPVQFQGIFKHHKFLPSLHISKNHGQTLHCKKG